MLFSLLSVFSASFFGYEIISLLLRYNFDLTFRISVGSCFGVILSTWIYFIVSLYIPLTALHGLVHTILLVIVSLLLHIIGNITQKSNKKPIIKHHYSIFTYIIAILIPSAIVFYFIYTGLLYKGTITKGAAYGDFAFHLNLISSFVYGCNKDRKSLFDITSPFFANETLAYPFIPNFYSAVLIACFDESIHDSAVWPSLVFVIAIFWVLVELTFQFTQTEVCCCISPYLFIFTGGLGFTQWFDPKIRNEYFIDYVHQWGSHRNEYWFQTIVHILMPQRASLFSIPLAWSVICILMKCSSSKNISAFICAGLIVASLAQVQPHSIIALIEWGVSYFLLVFPFSSSYKKWKQYIVNYWSLGVVALFLGVPQFLPFFGRTKHGFFNFAPLYLEIPNRNFITLWWYGLGAFIVLALFHVFLVLNKKQIACYIPSIFVFCISNFIWYQPWGLDNTKVFNAAFIPLACAGISFFLKKLFCFGWKGYLISAILFAFCIASGVMAAFRIGSNEYDLWSKREQPYEIANFVREHTDPHSVWITDSGHTNPIVTLAGRQTLAGYPGWLSSHNLDPSKRMNAIHNLERNPENTNEIDKLNVSYVAIRSWNNEINFKPPMSSHKWKLIYHTNAMKIYQRTK